MKFPAALVRGALIGRRLRFFADVDMGAGGKVVAHCANSGTMKTCADPGVEVALLPVDDPARKLKFSWELVRAGVGWACVNTMRPNAVVAEALQPGAEAVLPSLAAYATLRREVKYGTNSRIDVLLEGPRGRAWVEVKNVTLKDGPVARFPDAVTTRGLKHLHELSRMVRLGDRAVLVYFLSRPDCDVVGVARDVDPEYAKGVESARKAGVEFLAARAEATLEGLVVVGEAPVDLAR